jgi:cation diffusion facilitator CzcD-associated flavoprotein CzcO
MCKIAILRRYLSNHYYSPTAQYSFSFAPNYDSPSIYPTGKEYCDYLHSVVAKFDLARHI